MKRHAMSLGVVLVLIASVLLLGSNATAANRGEPDYPVSWSPEKISIAISPGGSWETDLIFTSKEAVTGISLFVVPELQPFVSITPQSFSTISASMSNTVHLDVGVPIDVEPGNSYEGTVHVKVGHETYPQTLKLLIYIAPPLETITEETYNATIALHIDASEMFRELEPSLGPNAASVAVVEWLLQQDEVLDTGISDDGTIWIAYKIGLDAIIPTAPPGTLSSSILSPSYEIKQDSMPLISGCTSPGSSSAIFLWPLFSDPEFQPEDGSTWTEHMAQITNRLTTIGYDVTCVRDADVTVDLLKSLYQYGLVDFFTHGGMWMSLEVMLMTGEECSFSSFIDHFWDIGYHRITMSSTGTWYIRPNFIEYYVDEPYPNSLVHAGACYSLANHTMANAFLDAGAYVYCGWSGETKKVLNKSLFWDLTEDKSLEETYLEWVDKGWTTDGTANWLYYPSDHGDLCLNANTVVYFPDPNLEAAIREAIGKPTGDIYRSDLDGLTELYADSKNIADLTGLEHCTDLRRLDLQNNEISNISPLSGLTSLRDLWIGGNQISNISPLSGLTSLVSLWICDNQVSDISPLSGLTSLWDLSLGQNQVTDIFLLSGLTRLHLLELSSNQISDISPLSGLTRLQILLIPNNQIGNIYPLSSLTDLEMLHLGYNQISDIKALVDNSGISSGDYVWLQDNPLSPTSIGTYIPQLQARGVNVSY